MNDVELLDILQRWYLNHPELKMDVDFMRGVTKAQLAEIKYVIKEIREQDVKAFDSMIGKEEDYTKYEPYTDERYALDARNEFRAELRTKLAKYRKETK